MMTRQRNRRPRPSRTRDVGRSIQDTGARPQPFGGTSVRVDTPTPDYEDMDEDELWATIYAEERAANPVLRGYDVRRAAGELDY